MKKENRPSFKLHTLDDIFTTQEERDDQKLERVRVIPINELHPFKDHPFKIIKDEEMEQLIESIDKCGTLTPILARPRPEGGYEVISSHRRLAACQSLNIETIPAIVREMTDDEAMIAMADANLQREKVLPSEKAFAYKMKLDAIKHQGATSTQVGEKLLSAEKVGWDSGDSRSQVQRYIRLTHLIPELLKKVDAGKIAFNPAVELSFLTKDEQSMLYDAMELNDCTPSHAQSIRLKKLSHLGELSREIINKVMAELKPNQQEYIKLRKDDLRKYFPARYSDDQMKKDIIKGLDLLKRKRERDYERDAR